MTDVVADRGPSRDELEEQRSFLLTSLGDLDAEWDAGDIGREDYVALKDDYTARAAAVLRAIERLDGKPSVSRSTRPAQAASTRKGRRPLWPLVVSGVVTLLVAASAAYFVTTSSGERLPGQEASGGPDQGPSELLQRAISLDEQGQVLEALKLYDAVIEEDPENVIALAYKGWLLGRQPNAELVARGMAPLDKAVEVDPTFADAHAFRGLVLIRNKRPGEAVCELRTYLAIAPPGAPQSREIEIALDEAIKQAGPNIPDCPKPIQPAPGQPGAPTTTIP